MTTTTIDDSPVWQDDSEVTKCFICNNSYNIFFNRRHHCRKCGKVVCGDCSQQFISYFPNTPIVTDPELNIPQYSRNRATYRTCDQCAEEITMIRRALFDNNNQTNSGCSSIVEERDEQPDGDDNNSVNKHVTVQHTRHLHSSTTSLPQINEDQASDSNLCPVCAVDLLKLYITDDDYLKKISNEDFETFKETHISQCLTNFDFDTNHSNRFSPDNSKTLRNKMLVYNIPPIPKPAYEPIDGESSSLPKKSEGFEDDDEYDEENECVICLEDLKPGDKVGRLECLCVFHYKCIKDWFNKKGYGECPVHFLHK
ncbi:PIB1 E3 ubiquitin-protein ligase PIB1 [Candida maltosa Xu316]